MERAASLGEEADPNPPTRSYARTTRGGTPPPPPSRVSLAAGMYLEKADRGKALICPPLVSRVVAAGSGRRPTTAVGSLSV